MATNSAFISASQFNGVSCQPGAGANKASIAYNVDTSRGTIRPREGFLTLKRFFPTQASGVPSKPIAVRILGVKSVRASSGFEVILVFMWDENTNHILFAVIDQSGNAIVEPKSVSTFPNTVRPGPYMYPVFANARNGVFIAFPSGQVFEYSYDEDPFNIRRVTVGNLGFKKTSLPYLDEFPAARIVYNFVGQMVVAGFDGDEKAAFSINIPEDQSIIPEDQITPTRSGLNISNRAIWFSDPDNPTAFHGKNWTTVATSQNITALFGAGNTFYAFTSSEIFAGAYNPNSASVQYLGKIHEGVGCASQRCIVEGNGMMAFLGHSGVYMLSGNSVSKISTDLDDMFTEDGWEMAPMYKLSQDVMGDVKYPFKILMSQLKFACGGYDNVRNLFWWSVPVAGTHFDPTYAGNTNHGHSSGSTDGTDEMIARVCIVYDPGRNAWNIWGSTDGTTFVPTCFDNTQDSGRPRFLFGDEFSGVNAYGEDSTDRLSTEAGGRLLQSGTEFRWFWQSHHLPLSQNTSGSARTLRVRQKARGGSLQEDDKTKWHVETEISFDQTDGELSFNGTISPNPSELYPKEQTPSHIWGFNSFWGTVKFHKKSTWKARYSVDNNIVGRTFQVGFSGKGPTNRSEREDIYDFDLEVQPKRDIT